jgi:hypothetical protein
MLGPAQPDGDRDVDTVSDARVAPYRSTVAVRTLTGMGRRRSEPWMRWEPTRRATDTGAVNDVIAGFNVIQTELLDAMHALGVLRGDAFAEMLEPFDGNVTALAHHLNRPRQPIALALSRRGQPIASNGLINPAPFLAKRPPQRLIMLDQAMTRIRDEQHAIAVIRRDALNQLLDSRQGPVAALAAELGISRQSLYRAVAR